MSVSLLGVIWIISLFLSLRKSIKYTVYLVMFSFVFQSAWVLLIGGEDLNATLVSCIFLVIRYIVEYRFIFRSPKFLRAGLVYAVFLIVISVIAPIVFDGLIIESMTNSGYNFGIVEKYRVFLSFSNLTQPLAVLLYVVSAIVIYNIRSVFNAEEVYAVFRKIYWFVWIFGIIHVLCMFFYIPTGIMREIFHNEYQIIGSTYFDMYLTGTNRFTRFMSTFYEPSYCGAYLAMCFSFFLKGNQRHKILYLVTCLAALVLNMSSTGLVTTSMVISVLAINWVRLNKKISKRWVLSISIGLVALVLIIIINDNLRILLYNFTFGKTKSGSYDLRSIVNGYAFDTFKNSYGVGVGVNTVESTSLVYALLSETGVVGTLLYCFYTYRVYGAYKYINAEERVLPFACVFCSLTASVLSCSALNFGMYWFSIFLLVIFYKDYRFRRT